MSITWISDWQITDSADTRFVLTYTVFRRREDAEAWVEEHGADLAEAIKAGTISGVHFQESRTPAQFIATTAEAMDYQGFAARVVAQPLVHGTIPALIIGIPERHARWLCGRLSSGLVHFAGPYPSLEEAIAHAAEGL